MRRILAILVSLFVLTAAALIVPIPVRAITAASTEVDGGLHYERSGGQIESVHFGWVDIGIAN